MQDNSARVTVIHDVREVSLTCEVDLNLVVTGKKCIQIKSDLLSQMVLIPQETGMLEEGVAVVPMVSKTSIDTFIVAFNDPHMTEDDSIIPFATVNYLKFAGIVVIPSGQELKLEVEVTEL